MILAKRPKFEIQARAVRSGMITLRQSAIHKMLRGETTLKEINRVTYNEGD